MIANSQTNCIAEYPTTDSILPDTSPLVTYLISSPLVESRFLHAIIVDAIAPYPQTVTCFSFKM